MVSMDKHGDQYGQKINSIKVKEPLVLENVVRARWSMTSSMEAPSRASICSAKLLMTLSKLAAKINVCILSKLLPFYSKTPFIFNPKDWRPK